MPGEDNYRIFPKNIKLNIKEIRFEHVLLFNVQQRGENIKLHLYYVFL